ncbi:hypothetical protein [Nocardioides daeguensis]|uniref:Secreted protein n=1 Tax=Nocardioides daeguensis TaxID=908359 RepID=A0ABP6V184_9ACTN|nr:hypothetical protein [Nocardioides daeguensis]MBV6727015.1 hypothetical protein [Nocardioides daeguensis]MCR1771582.1 hypothetical protein [Nocardioides daeguensis]
MRFTRTITVLLAAVTAVLLGLTTAPSGATASTAAGVSAERTLGPHPVDYTANEIRNTGRFKVKGYAATYQGGKIKLQQKKRGGNWRNFKKDRARVGDGFFQIKFDGPCWSKYRLVLKAANGYDKTVLPVGRIRCY